MKLQGRNLSMEMQGADVKLLQDELSQLGFAIAPVEKLKSVFLKSTQMAVVGFQKKRGIPTTGIVDEATAIAINAMVDAQHPTPPQPKPQPEPTPQPQPTAQKFVVQGRVMRADGQILSATVVRAVAIGPTLTESSLGEATSDATGNYRVDYTSNQFQLPSGQTGGPDLMVRAFDQSGTLLVASLLVRNAKPIEQVDLIVPAPPPTPEPTNPDNERTVEGHIFFDNGSPASPLSIRLYNISFGCVANRLSEGATDQSGAYLLTYNTNGQPANIQIRMIDTAGNELSLSKPKYTNAKHEVINLIAPLQAVPQTAEYDRLLADLLKQVGDIKRLAAARENDDCQDLTFLHQATGWDARLIAFMVLAVRLAPETGILQAALYALFRQGLPTEVEQLALVSLTTVDAALRKAIETHIVNLNGDELGRAESEFEAFSAQKRGQLKPAGVLSSFAEILSKSDLSSAEQITFEDLYFKNPDAGAELWEKAIQQGIPQDRVDKLRLTGKLAYLTHDNAELTAALHQQISSLDKLSQLVKLDLHESETWKRQLNVMADNNEEALNKLIPPAYEGTTTEQRLNNYSEDLARKVRTSFPTQVVGRLLEKDELKLGDNHDRRAVQTFLTKAEDLGFELGAIPVEKFVRENREKLFDTGTSDDQVTATKESVKTLQRLYQITPSNESLKVMAEEGFGSAREVAALPYEDFLKRVGDRFPTQLEAQLVYRKAQQVHAVTHNLLTTAKQLDRTPDLYAIAPGGNRREQAIDNLINQYPKMKSLFGSLDFCECEECRSALSPAAYFVDLLHFLDPEQVVWDSFLKDWKTRHNGERYDGDKQKGDKYDYQKPFDALIARRPDLPHLPLTCENTQTVLPYIDLVNEILEYYIVNGALDQTAAYDTGEPSSEELIAEPQNILPKAYDALKKARYPLSLPFDLWLETARRFCDHFDVAFWQVLDSFRATDELFPPNPDPQPKPYYRASVFYELLGLSNDELGIFIDPDPLAKWHLLYGFDDPNKNDDTNQADAMASLKSARTLAIRLGVSYRDLISIVRTGFVNPRLEALVILHKLGVNVDDVFRYKENEGLLAQDESKLSDEDLKLLPELKAFKTRLTDLQARFKFDGTAWIDTAWKNGDFNQILLLFDSGVGCNFDLTTLLYSEDRNKFIEGTDVHTANKNTYGLVLLKINLFVRLWQKLGWTIEETDRALQVFLPLNSLARINGNEDAVTRSRLLRSALSSALLSFAHLKMLDRKLKLGKNSRLRLLTFWSNLATTGNNPLYSQLFLTPSVLKNDAVFDDALGSYLAQDGIPMKPHLLAIQASINLSADEIRQILVDANKDPDTADLKLDLLSLLYRSALLAKALKLSIHDLISLKAMSGVDPFKPLKSDPVAKLDEDNPFSQTLRFIEIADAVKDSGLEIEDLDYLLRHRFDSTGKHAVSSDALLALVRSLATNVRLIRKENAVPSGADVTGLTDDVLRQKLASVFPQAVVETFFAMWNGTVDYQTVRTNVTADKQLDPARFATDIAIKISYDEVQRNQTLGYRGVLLDQEKATLMAKYPELQDLFDSAQKQAKQFFITQQLQKEQIGPDQAVGFLDPRDFDVIFVNIPPIPDSLTDPEKEKLRKDNEKLLLKKRTRLAETFLPFLQDKLITKLIDETMAGSLNADPALTTALLTDVNLLTDPSQPGKPLIDAFDSIDNAGVSLEYFASTDATGNALENRTVASVDTKPDASDQPKPNNANSAKLKGYFEVPMAGTYRFFVDLDKKDTSAEFQLFSFADPIVTRTAAKDNDEDSKAVELKAGVLYQFAVEIQQLNGGDVRLLIQSENLPKGSMARLTLYPDATVQRFQRGQVLLAKTLQIIGSLGLSEREVRYLTTHAADFNNLDFSKLPTREADDSPNNAITLFGELLRLTDFIRLRRDMGLNVDDLVNVFESNDAVSSVAEITRRDEKQVDAVVATLNLDPTDLKTEKRIRRVWEALQIVERLGVPADAFGRWANPAPDAAVARDLRDTVKARYERENWNLIAQTVFDVLRKRQRDALAAHIMHQRGLERIEQLFEYFLIDPGMEPVVQTSRLRLAISSVQLFIQRCFLKLEDKVHPSSLDSGHWQWMKRYRVWEANRKIFLFPENWLEPEFRDDKTHLCRELESALLQGDVTNDLAEDAFFNYLKKLEELAHLQMVTMYIEEKIDPDSNILHLIGRTHNEPHKYFYRRYAYQMWTPWEAVDADIEGDHIAAVIWQSRLHLFWFTFIQKGKVKSEEAKKKPREIADSQANTVAQIEVDVQLNWTEYAQGQWTTRKSGGFGETIRYLMANTFDDKKVTINVLKGNDGSLSLYAAGLVNGVFRLTSKNGQPQTTTLGEIASEDLLDDLTNLLESPYSALSLQATRLSGTDSLKIQYQSRIETQDGQTTKVVPFSGDVIQAQDAFSILRPSSFAEIALNDSKKFTSPIFYQDRDGTFLIQPSMSETNTQYWEGFGTNKATTTLVPNQSSLTNSKAQAPFVGDPPPPDESANFAIQPNTDQQTKSEATVTFEGRAVSRTGSTILQKSAAAGGLVGTLPLRN